MSLAVCVSFAIALGACSSGKPQRSAPKKHVRYSPELALNLDKTSGPPGARVALKVTGCDDPSGQNHAVSFNNDTLVGQQHRHVWTDDGGRTWSVESRSP